MISRAFQRSLIVIAAILLIEGLRVASAQENLHVLDTFVRSMATNPPGEYPLARVWIGKEKVTFSNAWSGEMGENRTYRLDTAIIWGDFRPRVVTERWSIGQRDTNRLVPGTLHAYRERLPTDAELAAIRDERTMTNVLLHPRFFSTQFGNEGMGLESRHFILGTNNTIETLSVYFYKRSRGTNLHSVTIRRGVFERSGWW